MPKTSLTISQALRWGTETLNLHHLAHPYKEASFLLRHCLQTPSHPILLDPEHKLTDKQAATYKSWIKRRSLHEPAAYIIGSINFLSYQIFVNKDVLIPRPETEQLVEEVIKYLKSLPSTLRSQLSILEVGTGSGAISIALALSLPRIRITASDISYEALKITDRNIKFHKLSKRIKLTQSNLLSAFPNRSADIILANLPYIPSHWMTRLDNDIILYEPQIALDGGSDGLELIKRLLIEAKDKAKPGCQIFLEIWHEHKKPLQQLIKNFFPQASITIKKDLAGLDRFAIITL